MANDEDVARLRQGVAVWNEWRAQNAKKSDLGIDNTKADLSGVDLSEVDLSGANLNSARLYRAKLIGAKLSGASLVDAHLAEAELKAASLFAANLEEADLIGASLYKADLESAHLVGANLAKASLENSYLGWANLAPAHLRGANLRHAHLHKAVLTSLSGALLDGTVFSSMNLSGTQGLNACRHNGPSVVDHLTLELSGRLPVKFLHGCGVPDWLIEHLPSPDKAIPLYDSCFVSYSSKDEAFVDRLLADLKHKGVPCWFAPEDMKIGDKVLERIEQAIKEHKWLLLVLSENSVSSKWVKKEVEIALEKERRQNRMFLFPVRLDDAVIECDTGWSADIQGARHIGDFSRWKDYDAYQKAFTRLLRDLKVTAPG